MVILLTGCSRGLGKYLCESLLADGHRVIGTDINPISEVKALFLSDQFHYFQLNLLELDSIRSTMKSILSSFSIDVIINNAGLKYYKSFSDIEDDDIEKVYKVNLLAPIVIIQEVLPFMLKKNSGRIINIASNAVFRGYKKASLYSSSKSALLRFSESVQKETESEGIVVCTLCPSTIATKEYMQDHPNANYGKLISTEKLYKEVKSMLLSNEGGTKYLVPLKQKMAYLYHDLKDNIRIIISNKSI